MRFPALFLAMAVAFAASTPASANPLLKGSYKFNKGGWTYEKAAMESSSYMKTTPMMAWFTANIGYHHIHHLNARIPFYRLPEVLREMPELQKPKTTSLNPFEIIRCLRLKVWDVEAQRMIRLPIADFFLTFRNPQSKTSRQ